MKTKPLIEDRPYTVAIAGARITAPTLQQAEIIAHNEINEWRMLSGRRETARIYYRDGSLVLTVDSPKEESPFRVEYLCRPPE